MASQLSQTLIKSSSSSSSFLKLLPVSLSSYQPRNLFSTKARLIQVDLDSSSSESEVLGLKRLEDAIQGIMARRLAPDWLPFIPGSSYWVPPQPDRSSNSAIVDFVQKLMNPLTPEQSLSLTSSRGWPSSSYFCQGEISEPVIPVEVEVQVFVPNKFGNAYTSEDED